MPYKYTMIFSYFSNITATSTVAERIGGWSESYVADNFDTATLNNWANLVQARLGICPLGTAVNRFRIQQIDPPGAAQLKKAAYAAPSTWLSDVPQMALKIPFFLGNTSGQILREFRGTPDVQVVTGEYQPTNPFTTALGVFLAQLQNGVWKSRRRDKTPLKSQILSVAVGGIVTMIDPLVAVAVGRRVQVIRSIEPTTGRKLGYFATVSAVVDSSHFTIAAPHLPVTNFGAMRFADVVYTPFAGAVTDNIEAVTRKVGRPFRSYSGRVSKRH